MSGQSHPRQPPIVRILSPSAPPASPSPSCYLHRPSSPSPSRCPPTRASPSLFSVDGGSPPIPANQLSLPPSSLLTMLPSLSRCCLPSPSLSLPSSHPPSSPPLSLPPALRFARLLPFPSIRSLQRQRLLHRRLHSSRLLRLPPALSPASLSSSHSHPPAALPLPLSLFSPLRRPPPSSSSPSTSVPLPASVSCLSLPPATLPPSLCPGLRQPSL